MSNTKIRTQKTIERFIERPPEIARGKTTGRMIDKWCKLSTLALLLTIVSLSDLAGTRLHAAEEFVTEVSPQAYSKAAAEVENIIIW